MNGLLWFYDMLVTSGCDPYHASAATAVVGAFGIYVVGRAILHLLNGR